MPLPNPLRRPRTLQDRLVSGAIILAALVLINLIAIQRSVTSRERGFDALRAAVTRHSALTEAKAELDDQFTRVRMLSGAPGTGSEIDRSERDRFQRSVAILRERVTMAAGDEGDAGLDRLRTRVDSIASTWSVLLELAEADSAAIERIVREAEPLASALINTELPAEIRAQNARVELASAAVIRIDRASHQFTTIILLASVLISLLLAHLLLRDLMKAIQALKSGAERFAAAELDYRVDVRNFDELADVGANLNAMADRLRSLRDELHVRNDELAGLAFRDVLTNLANRSVFRERVERALRQAGTALHEIAVLFVDLDNFKSVNDTYGHSAGDRLLIDVSARLLHATRGCDIVARLGGDEFAILLDVRTGEDAIVVAERVVSTLRKPFKIEDRLVHVGASVGVAWGHEGDGADELLRNADVAMYNAKEHGKGRYEVFAPAMHEALLARAELETDLRTAIERAQFVLEYQPIIDLATREIMGYEALVRWRHVQRGDIPPSTFIPIAEEAGVILTLGRWIVEEACKEAYQWQRLHPESPISVSVNVSSGQLEQSSFVDDLKRALSLSGLDPQRLVLEITESVIMRDSAVMLGRLHELKKLGIRLAIDDFGTGYSSLAYLQRFPVDIIKIDKAFVKSVAVNGSDAALARTIIMLSETLGMRTVAEGIEYHDQHIMLQELGCEFGQGFLFAHPQPATEVRSTIRALTHSATPTPTASS